MHRGCFVWTLTPPLAGRRTPRPGPVHVCVCLLFLDGSGGPAFRARSGAPHLFLWPLWLSALLGPLRAGVAPVVVLFFFLLPSSARPLCFLLSLVSGPGCTGPWRCVLFVLLASRLSALRALSFFLCLPPSCWLLPGGCPPPPLCLAVFLAVVPFLVFFFSLSAPPLSLAFSGFRPRVPWALPLCLAFFFLLASRLSVRSRFFFPAWPLAAPGCFVPPPPPPFVSGWFLRCRSVPPPLFFSLRAPPLSLAFSGFQPRVPWGLALCFVYFVGLPLLGSPCALSFFRVSPGRWLLPGGCCPPPPLPLGDPFFFFLQFAPPLSPAFSGFRSRMPWASAPRVVCFVGLPLLGSPCFLASFVPPVWPLAAPRWLLPPPPLCVSRFSSLPLGAVCRVLCCAVCPGLRCCAALLRVVSPGVVLLCAVLFCCAQLVPSGAPRRPGALCIAALCFAVLPRAVCVLSLRAGVCCCSRLCFRLCVSWGAVLCVPCPLRSVRCCASLCWCACVVLFVWCVLLLAPGAVVRCRVLCCFLWCAVVWCWVWWPVVVCWCRAVAPCCPFSFAGGVGLCLFPVCAVLCCAARRVVWFQLSLRCCRCLVLWRVPVCFGVSLGVLRCGCAALVCRGVLLCCALSCGVLRPVLCPAVLCCLAVLCWWAVLCGCLRCWCLFFLLSSFPLLKTPAVFPCL